MMKRELDLESVAVKIIIRPLLEEGHPQQPDDQQRPRGNAEHEVGDLKPARRSQRQLLLDQRELDRHRRHQREGAEVMEEGEQRGHRAGSPLPVSVNGTKVEASRTNRRVG